MSLILQNYFFMTVKDQFDKSIDFGTSIYLLQKNSKKYIPLPAKLFKAGNIGIGFSQCQFPARLQNVPRVAEDAFAEAHPREGVEGERNTAASGALPGRIDAVVDADEIKVALLVARIDVVHD